MGHTGPLDFLWSTPFVSHALPKNEFSEGLEQAWAMLV